MALDETALRAAGLPASLISLLVSITKAADRATFAANSAAAANDLAPQLAAAVQAIETLGLAPGMNEALADLAMRLLAVENATDLIPESILQRLVAVETATAAIPDEYDDDPVRALIAALGGRVSALEGTTVNRPPSSTVIPAQTIIVNTDYDEDFLGFFTDPDGDELELVITSGALPWGMVLEAGRIKGRPTTTGIYATTLSAYDPGGLRSSRTIAWTVQAVGAPDPLTTLYPTSTGYTGENYDHFLETPPVPTSTGYALETV